MLRPCVHLVFASNGDGFLFDDRTSASMRLETKLTLSEFPSCKFSCDGDSSWHGLDRRPYPKKLILLSY